ncbi:unnamed protein product [Fraxinus pennsylvanica]|uniref:RRM domain-containing protein n=1 Tax=Fraxinus pennsylvanica TaxID=56036 RepID=A0AAD1ZAR4_9LAMI|nr:unnamed protein product [Fraxinus pennsylvanica]
MAEAPPLQKPVHHLGIHEMVPHEASITLLVRHLPEAIPHDTLARLFSHYGASSVRPCTYGRARNCAFVDFKNEALASQVQKQLHGLKFLGKVLSVERARELIEDRKHQEREPQTRKDVVFTNNSTFATDLSHSSRRDSAHAREPISQKLGVEYPFPPHLEYAYPPPDGNILTNIVNALIAVPRFYTQVLHLMNKMNIPAPFHTALPTPPLRVSEPVPPPPPQSPPPLATKTDMEEQSSSESEMESSDDEEVQGEIGSKRKRVKRQAILGPAVDKDVAHEAVGLKPATLIPKEKPIVKKKNTVLQIKIAPKQVQTESKDAGTAMESPEPDNEMSDYKPYATLEELNLGKLPPEELLSLPMFKNYTAGNPASVLYVKNLAKDVVVDDFYYIFGSFFGSIDVSKSNLSVKLMQEGRMRGQAFVTFPSVELAHKALNAVNGYVFKGKPIVIQFGRSPASAKANQPEQQ